MPSLYLNQCWFLVSWTLRNKLQWNLNQNMMVFIQDRVFKNMICKMVTILFWLQCVNTLRPRQNGRHFPDAIFKCIFLNANVLISIKISLKFVPKGQISNIPTLVQVMAWRRPGDKPLFEPMMFRLPTHIFVTQPQWVNMLVYFTLL